MMCYTIEEIKDKTIPIAKKHGISRMCLFLMQEEKKMNYSVMLMSLRRV